MYRMRVPSYIIIKIAKKHNQPGSVGEILQGFPYA